MGVSWVSPVPPPSLKSFVTMGCEVRVPGKRSLLFLDQEFPAQGPDISAFGHDKKEAHLRVVTLQREDGRVNKGKVSKGKKKLKSGWRKALGRRGLGRLCAL